MMFGSFDISASALGAQRFRLDTIASNIASIGVPKGPDGSNNPYRRKFTIFQSQRLDGGPGVHVASVEEDQSPYLKKLEPGHPLADAQGWVKYPNVNLFTENVDALDASRAYEANVTAIETTKSMMNATLRLLA